MGDAQKKRQIGFITGQDTKHEPGPFSKKGPLGPDGPMLGLMRIRLEPGVYRSIVKSNFIKMRLKTEDGKFAIDMVLKNPESRLQLVPVRIPEISIHMEPQELSKLGAQTIVMLEDGEGNNRGYGIAAIREARLLDNGWTNRKRLVS